MLYEDLSRLINGLTKWRGERKEGSMDGKDGWKNKGWDGGMRGGRDMMEG